VVQDFFLISGKILTFARKKILVQEKNCYALTRSPKPFGILKYVVNVNLPRLYKRASIAEHICRETRPLRASPDPFGPLRAVPGRYERDIKRRAACVDISS